MGHLTGVVLRGALVGCCVAPQGHAAEPAPRARHYLGAVVEGGILHGFAGGLGGHVAGFGYRSTMGILPGENQSWPLFRLGIEVSPWSAPGPFSGGISIAYLFHGAAESGLGTGVYARWAAANQLELDLLAGVNAFPDMPSGTRPWGTIGEPGKCQLGVSLAITLFPSW